MEFYMNIAMVILSVALITVILLQSRGAGLGGLGGGDFGSSGGYHVRRGLEKMLFYVTIGLSAVFFIMAVINVIFIG